MADVDGGYEAMRAAVEIAKDPKAPVQARLAAAALILARARGELWLRSR